MIELPMKFVDGACGRIVPIHKLRVVQSPNGLFTTVANMADSVCTGLLLGKLLFQVIKPLKSLERLIDVGPLANYEGVRRWYGGGGERVKWCLRQYIFQALAMLIHLAMGFKPAWRSNSS